MKKNEEAIKALQKQKILLQVEYHAEKEAFRKQTEMVGIQQKVKRGDIWYPIRLGRSYYNSLNQKVLEVYRQEDKEIEHNFEYGRPVVFFSSRANAQKDSRESNVSYFHFTATVSYVDGDRMVVSLPESNNVLKMLQSDSALGCQLSFDETSYQTMFEALDRTINATTGRLAYLRDLFYSERKAERLSFAPLSFPWLNTTQEKAVNEVLLAKDIAIVHGPPGTGKTTTLVEAINETLMRESQVLVAAQSNMAVDWICEKLIDRGCNVLRIGNPARVNDKLLSFTYERKFESHPDYPQLWAIRKALRELKKAGKNRPSNYHQKKERLQARAIEIELRIHTELFSEARVVAATLVSSNSRIMEGQHFSTLFIDEAAQAMEAACWIPIKRVSKVVLAGDHCQLPPTVKSYEAMKAGLGKTLMERIVEKKPEVVTLLKVQYRMNEAIMKFSSQWFYGGKVESAASIKYRSILDYDYPIMWIDTSDTDLDTSLPSSELQPLSDNARKRYEEQFVGESFGRINKDEANLTLSVLTDYINKIGKERMLEEQIDIGIISPYKAQVQYLRRLIKKSAFFKPYRALLSVNTIDGFQGQERDVILISMVRANERGDIGFLNDLRRMNVAITRAKMKLIILGSKQTLTQHPFYKKLYEYIEQTKTADA